MKPSIIKSAIVLAMALLPLFSFGKEQITKTENETFVENEFIIWLEQGVDAATFSANSNVGISPKRMLSKRLNIWLFEIADKAESREVKMERLWKHPDVRVIQNNHTNITLREAIPDDPYFGQQWAPAIMSLPQAWEEFTTGGITATGDTIVVAVIDGGADWGHEDLNCWINTREIPNNGIDDDGNGYVDDYRGWNAYNHNGNVGANHHGTHVSGIIGAVGDNGKGVCGVNWNVKVMSICGSSSNESIVVEAYSYALEMRARYNETNGEEGAFIVATNSSFGVDYGNPDDYPIWCSMYDEMGNVGILSCGAGPNLNVNVDVVGDMPSACPGNYLIGITNTTSQDVKYGSAGYGIENIAWRTRHKHLFHNAQQQLWQLHRNLDGHSASLRNHCADVCRPARGNDAGLQKRPRKFLSFSETIPFRWCRPSAFSRRFGSGGKKTKRIQGNRKLIKRRNHAHFDW